MAPEKLTNISNITDSLFFCLFFHQQEHNPPQ